MASPISDHARYFLLMLALGCTAEPERRARGRAPIPALTDTVDCTVLPSAPAPVEGGSTSETLLSELGAGAARALLRWTHDGQEHWLLTPETTADIGFVQADEEGVRWIISVDLACDPEAATAVHFTTGSTDGVVPGEFPISAFGFDVPSLEQGASWPEPTPTELDGAVNVTSVSNLRATGFTTGYPRTKLRSYVRDEPLGIDVELAELVFRDIRVWE